MSYQKCDEDWCSTIAWIHTIPLHVWTNLPAFKSHIMFHVQNCYLSLLSVNLDFSHFMAKQLWSAYSAIINTPGYISISEGSESQGADHLIWGGALWWYLFKITIELFFHFCITRDCQTKTMWLDIFLIATWAMISFLRKFETWYFFTKKDTHPRYQMIDPRVFYPILSTWRSDFHLR